MVRPARLPSLHHLERRRDPRHSRRRTTRPTRPSPSRQPIHHDLLQAQHLVQRMLDTDTAAPHLHERTASLLPLGAEELQPLASERVPGLSVVAHESSDCWSAEIAGSGACILFRDWVPPPRCTPAAIAGAMSRAHVASVVNASVCSREYVVGGERVVECGAHRVGMAAAGGEPASSGCRRRSIQYTPTMRMVVTIPETTTDASGKSPSAVPTQ